MQFVKRCLLVTGASSGIGRAIAEQLLDMGHQVIGTSRECRKFTRQHARFVPWQLDLSVLDSLIPAMQELLREFPHLDGAVFSAGIGRFGSLEEFSPAQIAALMNVNFTGNVLLTKALLPLLKRNNAGNLIYIGSEAALKGSRKGSIYCASKFALRGFTQALREEAANSGVRVTLINPGMVKTPFFESLNFEPGPESDHSIAALDVAQAVKFVLESSSHIVLDEINLSPLQKVIQFKK